MATSGRQDDSETETAIDVSGFMRAFTHDDDGEDSDGNSGQTGGPGDISMFCKACLHPYCGEQKAGTIVLRCERCGQTDTVLEERIDSLNPQEWIGNLMMNRFMQVVKEQEDLSANLTDPHFTNDEYQRISLTLSEYTFNIEKLAAQMFDIAKKARVASDEDKARIEACNDAYSTVAGLEEVQAMNATKTLIEIHKTLVMNDPVLETSKQTSEDVVEECIIGSSHQMDQVKEESVAKDETGKIKDPDNVNGSQDSPTDENVSSKTTNPDQPQEVVTLHADVETSDKCREARLLELTRERLDHLGPTIMTLIETLISKYNLPDDVMATVEERLRNANNADDDIDAEAISEEEAEDKKDLECADSENKNRDDTTGDDSGDDDTRTIFNIPTETIKNEVFAALEHKLKLSFDETERAPRKFNLDQTDELCSELSELKTAEDDSHGIEGDYVKTGDDLGISTEEFSGHNEDTSPKEKDDSLAINNENNGDENNEESFMVNFYSLSSEFIRELQRRKSKALGERKDKALANIHDKIQRLKKEMERVEETVTEELTLAYKRKMKKVEKQRKQLDEKHDQVKEAERLLEYYAMTGQQDKLAELMEQFNIQYEN